METEISSDVRKRNNTARGQNTSPIALSKSVISSVNLGANGHILGDLSGTLSRSFLRQITNHSCSTRCIDESARYGNVYIVLLCEISEILRKMHDYDLKP